MIKNVKKNDKNVKTLLLLLAILALLLPLVLTLLAVFVSNFTTVTKKNLARKCLTTKSLFFFNFWKVNAK